MLAGWEEEGSQMNLDVANVKNQDMPHDSGYTYTDIQGGEKHKVVGR